MRAGSVPAASLERAVRRVCASLDGKRLPEGAWRSLGENELWRELTACILGSRVRYDVAYSALQRMEESNLLVASENVVSQPEYVGAVLRALSVSRASEGDDGSKGRYPFCRSRARQIGAAARALYSGGGSIRSRLAGSTDVRVVRRQLARDVAGLGPKQASLFLRNTGYSSDVAVLDVHVLTYMNWVGLTPVPVKTVPTVRQYEMLEDVFVEHSYSYGFSPCRFDLAVWVVVRVVKQEYASCR